MTPRAVTRVPRRVWLAALLPLLPVALALAVHVFPESDDVVSLDGTWEVAGDDGGWSTFTVPGRFRAEGRPRSRDVVIRRAFAVPERLRGGDLFLMVPNVRGAFARVSLNGRLLGEKGTRESDTSLDVGRLDGFTVPADLLAEANVLELALRYPIAGDALPDGRFLLGKPAVVKTYLERNVAVKHLLEYGALLVSLLGAGLIAYLLSLAPGNEDRNLSRAALSVMVVTVLYLCGKTGVVIGFFFGSADVNAFITYTIIGIGFATPELVESYYLRRTTRFRRINRVVCGLAFVASLVFGIAVVYTPFSLWLFVVIVHAIVFAVRDLARPQTAYGPVLASAIAITAATAAVDLFSDLNIAFLPRLFSYGVANLGVIAAVVVIGDFLRLSRALAAQNEALAIALAAAEESARLKGEFLANTSHELRTPLNAIINIPQALLEKMEVRAVVRCGSCQALFAFDAGEDIEPPAGEACPSCGAAGLALESRRVGPDDGELLAARLGAVVSAGKHLLGVVNDILDVSKLAALESKGEAFALDLSDISVGDVVRAAVETVEPLAEKAGVAVRMTIEPGLMTHGDRVRLAQVLINLLSNALKFSAKGARIDVDAAARRGAVEIGVRDEGQGIAAEHHALIFESFRQVEGGHTRKHGGTGLGLAIAKKLIELHGGTITVKSALGQGATFTIRLPAVAALTSAARSDAAATTSSPT